MLILLPPSETKRPGGDGPPLRLDALALPALRPERAAVVEALVELSSDEDAAARVLRLSARQRGEIAVNAALLESPTMPAVDRYTGVLFDALGAHTLDAASRRWLGEHVLIHSAPFGPVGADDLIPAYRLAAGTALPGVPPLRRLWAAPVTAALSAASPRFVLDLRSEAYVALGPVPAGIDTAYVRVVTEGDGGAARALNHFNKHAKGDLVRALTTERPRLTSTDGFLDWAARAGRTARRGRPGEIDLVV
ncbi:MULTISPECIES: YaaA family protein [Microbacterium]|uniref:Peroxide stress protein YaaA n=1 Tax=Microbacterium wangchenii TaxID=2541726 RepID=A0ABX5SQ24_9MICO|nr:MULTISPECIES: peroxide stress protein YaaA [Microbacterium]MCK6066938.1 peroxide stress protein YaaA [Microbacterium sp. EYE_512]QBR88238.1 peroxide stress protein YaaA [Microbacterium wangchenii]TXK17972.1 peroxide stress protein YaaA [Microbacterium wangchenii]